jgi:hypothetical protein
VLMTFPSTSRTVPHLTQARDLTSIATGQGWDEWLVVLPAALGVSSRCLHRPGPHLRRARRMGSQAANTAVAKSRSDPMTHQ